MWPHAVILLFRDFFGSSWAYFPPGEGFYQLFEFPKYQDSILTPHSSVGVQGTSQFARAATGGLKLWMFVLRTPEAASPGPEAGLGGLVTAHFRACGWLPPGRVLM